MLILIDSFWQTIAHQFTLTTKLEWFGTITGFACVYLAAKQHILNWPISILSVVAYAFLFFDFRLYGDAVLQLYFLSTAIYGWYYWVKRKNEHQKPIETLTLKEVYIVILAIAILAVILGLFLDRFTNSDVPYVDGFCTSMSFVAQYLMTRKIWQNWIIWIIVDACYVPLYLYKELALTAVLYLVFLGIALLGYLDWKKSWKQTAR